jgi:hypothetical protein
MFLDIVLPALNSSWQLVCLLHEQFSVAEDCSDGYYDV